MSQDPLRCLAFYDRLPFERKKGKENLSQNCANFSFDEFSVFCLVRFRNVRKD